jgi:hypothetical protein
MKYLLILILFLVSCGTMKKTKSTSIDEGSVKTDSSQTEETKTATTSFQNSSFRIENNGYTISVKPVNGQNSFFNFTSPDGQMFHGTTNAEINFEQKAEKQEVTIKTFTETVTYFWLHTTYKSHTKYKTVSRYIDKYKEAYPWYYILFAGFLLREIIGWLWKWMKNSQWYLNIVERLIKKR